MRKIRIQSRYEHKEIRKLLRSFESFQMSFADVHVQNIHHEKGKFTSQAIVLSKNIKAKSNDRE